MLLTIFGATGRTGRMLVRQAVDRGDSVVAVVRRPADLAGADVRLVPDLADTDAVREAIAGSDAVLSAIGPHSRRDAPAAGPATRHILAADVRRIVVVSAAPVAPPPSEDSALSRRVAAPLVSRVFRPVYDDLREMEAALTASRSEWTAFRPPLLTSGPATGRYRLRIGGAVPHGLTVSRADLAAAMLESLDRADCVRTAVGIAAPEWRRSGGSLRQ